MVASHIALEGRDRLGKGGFSRLILELGYWLGWGDGVLLGQCLFIRSDMT